MVNAAARLQPPPLEQMQERDLVAPGDDGRGTGRSGAATPDPGARKAAGGLGFRLLSMGMKERERCEEQREARGGRERQGRRGAG